MKRFIKPIAILCLILCSIGLVPAQQIQTLQDTDSLKQRREKTNANFDALNHRIDSVINRNLLDGLGYIPEKPLSFSSPLNRNAQSVGIANADATHAGIVTTGAQTIAGAKTFTGIVTAPAYVGNGSGLTGITGATGGVNNTGSTTVGAASDADHVGKISFQVGGVEVGAFENNGLFTQAGGVSAKVMGAHGDGVTADSTALNAAAAVSASSNLPVILEASTYAISAPLDSALKNVRFICPKGSAKFIKLADGTSSIFANVPQAYKGWSFEGIEFDGNGATGSGSTIVLTDTSDIRFVRCKFRNLTGQAQHQAVNRITYYDCDFYGTSSGVMQAGTDNPPAVTNASYGSGFVFNGGSNDITAERCRFHFVRDGAFAQIGSLVQKTRGFKVTNCQFRGDYWNGPYNNLRFAITAYSSGTATVAAGGLTGHFPTGNSPNEVSIAVPVGTGSNLSLFGGVVTTTGSFGNVQVGDVIETSNGKRAEIVSFTNSRNVQVSEWEAMETFEPTAPPAANTAWRVSRYYAASAQIVDDTHLSFYFEPVNPFSGESITAAGIATPWTCRELPNIGYTGVHINGGSDDTLIQGNRFRGGWGDQISIFRTEGARVIGNTVEYGQDEGITLTLCPKSVVIGNTLRYSGVSAVSINQSHYSVINGNVIDSWAVVNRYTNRGAIEFEDSTNNVVIQGNTFSYNTTLNLGGLSPYALTIFNNGTGSIMSGNTGRGRTGDLYVDSNTFTMIATDVSVIAGAGAPGVYSMKSAGRVLFGSSTPVTGAQVEVRSANDTNPLLVLLDAAGNPKFSYFNGNVIFSAPAATGSTSGNSSVLDLRSTYWNGTASVAESFTFDNQRISGGAGNFAARFKDNDGMFPLSMAGKGGQVTIGYPFPSNGNLSMLGQFHARSLATTTPTLTAQRIASQSADIIKWMDESSATLGGVDKDGGLRLRSITFSSLPSSTNGTLFYCSDCTKTTPCAGSGTGAIAKRLNGAWDCN